MDKPTGGAENSSLVDQNAIARASCKRDTFGFFTSLARGQIHARKLLKKCRIYGDGCFGQRASVLVRQAERLDTG